MEDTDTLRRIKKSFWEGMQVAEGKDISKIAYQKYKLDWFRMQNYTTDFIETIIEEYLLFQESDDDMTTLYEYIEEYGFGGECWVCYDEFMNAEYKDTSYMLNLLTPAEYFKYQITTGNLLDNTKEETYYLLQTVREDRPWFVQDIDEWTALLLPDEDPAWSQLSLTHIQNCLLTTDITKAYTFPVKCPRLPKHTPKKHLTGETINTIEAIIKHYQRLLRLPVSVLTVKRTTTITDVVVTEQTLNGEELELECARFCLC